MPKASVVETSESEMLVAARAGKVASQKSGRSISTSAVIAASTAGGSKRAVSTRKGKEPTQGQTIESVKTLASSPKTKEAIQAILDTLEEETMHKSWYDVLKHEFTKPYFNKVHVLLPKIVLSLIVFSLNNFWSRRTLQTLSIHQVSTFNVGAFHLSLMRCQWNKYILGRDIPHLIASKS